MLMNKNLLSTVIFIFILNTVHSQKTTLKGIVTNEDDEPLISATIIAKPSDKNKAITFASTDNNGKYVLDLVVDIAYDISISHIGFHSLSLKYIPAGISVKNFQLTQKINELEEVTIEFKAPISIKKDTTEYKVEAFITGEEQKLRGVLDKLPGLEVDKDGTITSKGKTITHVLVENKSFFGGNSKLAVENIPADAINEIQIIEDYNDISFLKGMTKSENIALNVKLKADKKNFAFGEMGAGKGIKDFYEAKSNIFYYNPKLNLNLLTGSNNIGEEVFTYSDYRNFIGKPSNVFLPRDNDIVNGPNSFLNFSKPTDNFKIKNDLGAISMSKTSENGLDISGYLVYSTDKSEALKLTSNEYILPDISFFEETSTSIRTRRDLFLMRSLFKYTISNKQEFSLDILHKLADKFQTNLLSSQIDSLNRALDSDSEIDENYFNLNFEWHNRLTKQHAFSLNSSFEKNNQQENSFWKLDNINFSNLLKLENQSDIDLHLVRNSRSNNAKTIFKYMWSINRTSLLHATFGFNNKSDYFYTLDEQILPSGERKDLGENDFNNELQLQFNDIYLGAYHYFKVNEFEFHNSIFMRRISWSLDKINNNDKVKFLLLPEISIRKRARSSNLVLRLDSNVKSSFFDAAQIVSDYYLLSYNSAYFGNQNLENEYSHKSSFSLSNSNLFRGLYFLAALNYEYKINGFTKSILTSSSDNIFSTINLNHPNNSLSSFFVLRKSNKNFKYTLTSNISTTNNTKLVNNVLTKYNNNTGSYRLAIKSLNHQFPIIEIGYEHKFGVLKTNQNSNRFSLLEPFIRIDYDFSKYIIFSFDYTYSKYKNSSSEISNSYQTGNMSLLVTTANKKWAIKLLARNLFNNRVRNKNNINEFMISDESSFVMPRVGLLSITYKL